MEQLLRKLGINQNQSSEKTLEELCRIQMEYLERLDNVEDEKRRIQLEKELKEIESVINTLSWLTKRTATGIRRNKESVETDNFVALKNQETAKSVTLLQAEPTDRRKKTEEELYEEALAIMATQEYAKGVELMRKLADSGYHQAQFQMGKMFFEGKRVVKDILIAAEWYQKAANQGNASAQYNLAVMYDRGDGVAQNDGLAAEWYQKAANQGHAYAQYNLGWMYLNGGGVEKNDGLAAEWFQKAAEQEIAEAQGSLGWMYENGRGVVQNDRMAAEWYQKAANQGDSIAQCNIGLMYEMGRGVVRNDKLAVEWYQKAADQGHEGAINNLRRIRRW